MDIILVFMVLATMTPFLFIRVGKRLYAVIQSFLLVGMWIYYFSAMFQTTPSAFSFSWTMFYASLIVAEVAWVMFIIDEVKTSTDTKKV